MVTPKTLEIAEGNLLPFSCCTTQMFRGNSFCLVSVDGLVLSDVPVEM